MIKKEQGPAAILLHHPYARAATVSVSAMHRQWKSHSDLCQVAILVLNMEWKILVYVTGNFELAMNVTNLNIICNLHDRVLILANRLLFRV